MVAKEKVCCSRCVSKHFERERGFYPSTRAMDLKELREKLDRPIEATDLDGFIVCAFCKKADDEVAESLLGPNEKFVSEFYSYPQTASAVRKLEESFGATVACSECGHRTAKQNAFVPGFNLAREKKMPRLTVATLEKVAVCADCLGERDGGYYPLLHQEAVMKRAEEQEVRSREAALKARGLLTASLGEMAGTSVSVEETEDGTLVQFTPTATVKKDGEKTTGKEGAAKLTTKRKKAVEG